MRARLSLGRAWLADHVFSAKDTPHHLALGVALGLLVGWSPTFGLQILLYLALAAVIGANKAVGLPFVFIVNPLTAAPVYYLCWRVGALVLGTSVPDVSAGVGEPASLPRDGVGDVVGELFSEPFWEGVGARLLEVGAELWVGSLGLGVVTGAAGYALTYRAVVAHRRRARPGDGS